MTTSASRQATTVTRALPASTELNLPVDGCGTSVRPQRQSLIAEAAFFLAQARGFEPGHELDDWLAAEREVDRRLSATEH